MNKEKGNKMTNFEQKLVDMLNVNTINCDIINSIIDQFIVDNNINVIDGDEIGIDIVDNNIYLRVSNSLVEDVLNECDIFSADIFNEFKTVTLIHECLEIYYKLNNEIDLFGSHVNKKVIKFEKEYAIKLNVYEAFRKMRENLEIENKGNYEAIYDLTNNIDAKYWLDYISELEVIYN